MSTQSIVLVARFSPNNKQAENKLLSFLAKGSEFALEGEPGTLKYAPEVATHPDPLLLLTDIQYKPGKVEAVLPCWRGVFERTRDDEEGALHWQLARDSKHPDRILVAHTYESRDYLLTVHAAGKELKELQAFVKDIQVSMKPVFLKIEGGYLHK
ncbi:hypothetical protein BHE90_016109 [Fusarium euwallaceae]|uniref:ABM domain-containing protein n=3 Tax=Fusarium solani species complex TaxID=232080 RepID=A0A3M2RF12_9HYPO|nr:hypothetical protein CDV36_014717 [Fusarium kuroshium]RSL55501.1 hypothetical protein CEP51_014539 [Fusarium floridanum]RTE69512.1 hypothetical protein BHE90_016109 [Fusarium euwallaceae]